MTTMDAMTASKPQLCRSVPCGYWHIQAMDATGASDATPGKGWMP
jgi:hypothetical protein